ncbi:MAG: large conductance mechanosensitive channel protein MscL [Erysipelotrichaceae bacterium]|nr:large conductance mechanosensitive channel protein MscL [Erysipelotrichaceae bacterium]
MKEFIEEFKKFINRGNVVDLAVGVIIGGAFTSIVTSLVDDIIMPIIGTIIGGINFSGIAITVGDANIMIGNFIQNIVNFLIVALVVFMVVRTLNKAQELKKKEPEPEEVKEDPDDIKLLKSIEKELKKLNKK